MAHRVVQTAVVWLVSVAVAVVLAAVPGMPTLGVAIGYLAALVVAERLSRRVRTADGLSAAVTSPDAPPTGDERADWRTFLPAIFATSTAIATDLSILDPPDLFVRGLTVVSAVAFGAFLVTDELFRRRPTGR